MGSVDNQQADATKMPAVEDATDARLKRIEEKLEAVEKRLSDKWILPVSMAVLTAILTFGNYLVQRQFLNSDIFKNEVNKTNAGFKSRSTSDFYRSCYEKLDTINKSFSSYCVIGASHEEENIITQKQIQLTALIDHQFPIDPKVKQSLQEYNSYVAERLVDFQDSRPENQKLKHIYNQSAILYSKAVLEINAAFLNPDR